MRKPQTRIAGNPVGRYLVSPEEVQDGLLTLDKDQRRITTLPSPKRRKNKVACMRRSGLVDVG